MHESVRIKIISLAKESQLKYASYKLTLDMKSMFMIGELTAWKAGTLNHASDNI